MSDLIRIERDRDVARVILNRPEVNNALNENLIQALHSTFEELATDSSVAAIIVSGEGRSLCAGADINWMRKASTYSRDDNIADLLPLGRMLGALDRMPQTTIARVHG